MYGTVLYYCFKIVTMIDSLVKFEVLLPFFFSCLCERTKRTKVSLIFFLIFLKFKNCFEMFFVRSKNTTL